LPNVDVIGAWLTIPRSLVPWFVGLAAVGARFTSTRDCQCVLFGSRNAVGALFTDARDGRCVNKLIPKLTPTAEFESNYIATSILGNPASIAYPVIPNLVFTLPRISQCGVSVDESKAQPDTYRVVSVPYGQQLTSMAKSDKESDFTFVVDGEGILWAAPSTAWTRASSLTWRRWSATSSSPPTTSDR
jgi:hypothetical protein